MKDTELQKLLQFKNTGGALLPVNDKADDYMLMCRNSEVVYLKDATKRDIGMHRCYMALLGFVYDYLPANFKKRIPKPNFYNFIKHIQGKYEVQYSFADEEKISDMLDDLLEVGLSAEQASFIAAKYGKTDMIEYESIAFGNMSQKRFKEYISEQMPVIYENILGRFFEGDVLAGIVETIENDFDNLMKKLI